MEEYVKQFKIKADVKEAIESVSKLDTKIEKLSLKDIGKSFASEKFNIAFFENELKNLDTAYKNQKMIDEQLSESLNSLSRFKLSSSTQELLSPLFSKSVSQEERDKISLGLSNLEQTEQNKELVKTVNEILNEITNLDIAKLTVKDEYSNLELSKQKVRNQNVLKLSEKLFDNIYNTAKDFFEDVYSDAKSMLNDIASFDLENSKRFNQEAISLAINWGLTGAEAYAAEQAAEFVGYEDFSDLVSNLWAMNDVQKEEFEKMYDIYYKSYEQNQELALSYQEFNTEWKAFKDELAISFMTWFSENKDTIKMLLSGTVDLLKSILDAVSYVVNLFGGISSERTISERAASAADIISSYTTSNMNNIQIKNDITINGSIDKTTVENAVNNGYQQNYRQMLNVFKGGRN